MSARLAALPETCLGIIDLGSNSLRLLIVRTHSDGSSTVLNQVKQMVRLGEGGFLRGRLQEAAMARTLDVLEGMAKMCAAYKVSELLAVATAAVRDAENGKDFLARVKERTGIEMSAISGSEEARLIYLGVSSGLEHTNRLRLFIDIGGGSTELAVGNSRGYKSLESVKLGCVRLTNLFFKDKTGPVSAKEYATVQGYVRGVALHAFQRIADFEIAEAVASSGTAQNLAEIAASLEEADAQKAGRPSRANRGVLSYDGLLRVVRELRSRTLEERRALPGINPNRADVLIGGAAVLQTIMEEQGFESVLISNRNLQNGVLVDYLMRLSQEPSAPVPSRERSVLRLARFCRFEETHSRHVARLALELFDSAAGLGLNGASHASRELLYYAGLLHDIGIFIAFTDHNAHSHYLIRNTELLGFTSREIEIIAALAYFHRKRPSGKHQVYLDLDDDAREEVRLLSVFLNLAERMDKSHRQVVRATRLARAANGGVELHILTAGDCLIEGEEIERGLKLLRKTYDRRVTLCRYDEAEIGTQPHGPDDAAGGASCCFLPTRKQAEDAAACASR
ncbi:MAG TPA: Ppx/GppA family phosphatase [Candidatus Avidesulfovibrio excrementigallinarum]|nr:Ppx/GppA family phosphatase [Candidatus Avidesulfovibrio excrementigallinarum]